MRHAVGTALMVVTAMLLLGGGTPAGAQRFANVDTVLTPEGVLFIGGTDKFEYSLTDTVEVILMAFNPADTTVYFFCPVVFCQGAIAEETWCGSPTPGADTLCVPMQTSWATCNVPGTGRGFVFVNPGTEVLTHVLLPPLPDDLFPPGWRFNDATVEIPSIWQPPRFTITVHYVRRTPTAVEARTWARLKQLYR